MTHKLKNSAPTSSPIERLISRPLESFSDIELMVMIQIGFEEASVKEMLSSSQLYLSIDIMQRIRDMRPRKPRRSPNYQASDRLTAQQSAIAFQFAKTLEHSTLAFGSLELAEEWLSHPCRHLADLTPVDLIENAIGFQLVEIYLERIIMGVYQ